MQTDIIHIGAGMTPPAPAGRDAAPSGTFAGLVRASAAGDDATRPWREAHDLSFASGGQADGHDGQAEAVATPFPRPMTGPALPDPSGIAGTAAVAATGDPAAAAPEAPGAADAIAAIVSPANAPPVTVGEASPAALREGTLPQGHPPLGDIPAQVTAAGPAVPGSGVPADGSMPAQAIPPSATADDRSASGDTVPPGRAFGSSPAAESAAPVATPDPVRATFGPEAAGTIPADADDADGGTEPLPRRTQALDAAADTASPARPGEPRASDGAARPAAGPAGIAPPPATDTAPMPQHASAGSAGGPSATDNSAGSQGGNAAATVAAFGGEPRAAADTVAAAAAQAAARTTGEPAAEQLAVRISRAVNEGTDRFTIQMRPAELGRVSVRLELGHDQRLIVVIAAERSDTLELLQRDARTLERALQQAGLNADSGSLSFEARGEGGAGNPFNDDEAPAQLFAAPESAAEHPADSPAALAWRLGTDRLDIRI